MPVDRDIRTAETGEIIEVHRRAEGVGRGIQNLFGKVGVEERDDRAHAKRRDDCTDADRAGKQKSDPGADNIRQNAAPFVRDRGAVMENKTDRIIRPHAERGSKEQGRRKAQKNHAAQH